LARRSNAGWRVARGGGLARAGHPGLRRDSAVSIAVVAVRVGDDGLYITVSDNRGVTMNEILLSGLKIGESARWHDGWTVPDLVDTRS
jgi:hypothetical protein